MNIHVIRSNEVNPARFNKIIEFLSQFPGGDIYIPHNYNVDVWDELEEELIEPLSWKSLFELCEDYRLEYNIVKEDILVLITDIPDDRYYIGVADYENNNVFIHSGNWDQYIHITTSQFKLLYYFKN